MSNKSTLKKQRCIKHRELEYMKAINKVIDGIAEPEYATNRFKKLKQVRGK